MTKLHDLYDDGGQSPWIDNLKRSYLGDDGRLASLVAQGVRGVTSNPTILARAIEGEDDYDEQFAALAPRMGVEAVYWDLVIEDILGALSVLRATHEASGGADGFVSIEVAPDLAHDTAGTIAAARSLHQRIARPNLFVKIPATPEGVPAIRQMTAEGRSINVTLIFSIQRYGEVIEAYLSGLEELVAGDGRPAELASVASFFVSRVDTEVDRRLQPIIDSAEDSAAADKARQLRGRAAIANAKLAYELFTERFSGPRWERLASAGARAQRPLWASTSTKNPAYDELVYVDGLIGPDTVNTMPDATLEAFLDHGRIARTIDTGVAEAHQVVEELAVLGIDIEDVAARLEDEGVAAFAKSFEELMQVLSDKARSVTGGA